MQIPVFVSCPTSLNPSQEQSRNLILQELEVFGLEPRAVGRSDYPIDSPLREVLMLAKRCSGGLVLGFEQFLANSGVGKRNTTDPHPEPKPKPFPTAWNHIEAGILFSIGLPLLVFKEEGIDGGIFDHGISDAFIQKMPIDAGEKKVKDALQQVFSRWQARVRKHYYME